MRKSSLLRALPFTCQVALLLTACAGLPGPPGKSRAGAFVAAPAPTAPALQVEVEGSSRDEIRRPFLLSLGSQAAPTLREDEALRMVSAALEKEGYRAEPIALGGNGPGEALKITARFTKESSGFGFFGGPRHGVHLEAYGNSSGTSSGGPPKGARLVWEYHASAVGERDDIRPILPTLLAAGRGFIGGSTAGKRLISIAPEGPAARIAPVASSSLPAPAKKSARRGLLQR